MVDHPRLVVWDWVDLLWLVTSLLSSSFIGVSSSGLAIWWDLVLWVSSVVDKQLWRESWCYCGVLPIEFSSIGCGLSACWDCLLFSRSESVAQGCASRKFFRFCSCFPIYFPFPWLLVFNMAGGLVWFFSVYSSLWVGCSPASGY